MPGCRGGYPDDYEEYEWAGQTRMHSTSLFQGGLAAAAFLTIQQTRQDAVLDATGEGEEEARLV